MHASSTRSLAFPLVLIVSLMSAPASAKLAEYQAAVASELSLISQYTFDASSGGDSRGLHPGAVAGSATFPAGVGGEGKAFAPNAVARVTLGRVEDFDFTDTTGTVECWVRPTWSTLTYNTCIIADRDGGAVRWSLHMDASRRAVGMWNGSGYLTRPIPDASTNWHHLACVFDNDSMTLYWDGESVGTITHTLGSGLPTTQIGSSSAGVTAEGFPGEIDEVAFYSDALGAMDIQEHYAALFQGSPPVIVAQPRGGIFLPGVELKMTVKATGPNLSYQWYKDSLNPIPGATDATFSIFNLGPSDAGSYHVVVSNPAANVPSDPAPVALNSVFPVDTAKYQETVTNTPGLVAYYTFDRLTADTAVGFYGGVLQGSAAFAPGIGGQPAQSLLLDGSGHVSIGFVPELDFGDLTGSLEAWIKLGFTADPGYDPCIFANREGGATLWSVHMYRNRRAIGNWTGSDWQTVSIPDPGTNWHHLLITFDNGTNTFFWDGVQAGQFLQLMGVSPSTVQIGSVSANNSSEAWLGALDEVAFYSDALPVGTAQDHFRAFLAGTPPAITVEPVGGAFLVGNPLQLAVSASGADMVYQWHKDTVPMVGQTDSTLDFPALALSDAGLYHVTISNPAGSTNSATVAVVVGNNLPSYQAAVSAEPSLISYFTFDAATAADSKGTNHGVAVNLVSFTPGAGTLGQSLLLEGTGHVNLGPSADLAFTNGAGTIEAWVRPGWTSDPGYAPCLFANRYASALQVDWSIHMVSAQNQIGNWNGLFFQTLPMFNPGGWRHFAVTFGDDHVQMYWDGELIGDLAQPINIGQNLPTQLGSSDPDVTTEGWIGTLDEVAFYREPLSAGAVMSHYLAMVSPAAERPTLEFVRSGNSLTLSWPAEAIGFTLESAEALPAASWNVVGGVVNNSVTLTLTTGASYFRLRK